MLCMDIIAGGSSLLLSLTDAKTGFKGRDLLYGDLFSGRELLRVALGLEFPESIEIPATAGEVADAIAVAILSDSRRERIAAALDEEEQREVAAINEANGRILLIRRRRKSLLPSKRKESA